VTNHTKEVQKKKYKLKLQLLNATAVKDKQKERLNKKSKEKDRKGARKLVKVQVKEAKAKTKAAKAEKQVQQQKLKLQVAAQEAALAQKNAELKNKAEVLKLKLKHDEVVEMSQEKTTKAIQKQKESSAKMKEKQAELKKKVTNREKKEKTKKARLEQVEEENETKEEAKRELKSKKLQAHAKENTAKATKLEAENAKSDEEAAEATSAAAAANHDERVSKKNAADAASRELEQKAGGFDLDTALATNQTSVQIETGEVFEARAAESHLHLQAEAATHDATVASEAPDGFNDLAYLEATVRRAQAQYKAATAQIHQRQRALGHRKVEDSLHEDAKPDSAKAQEHLDHAAWAALSSTSLDKTLLANMGKAAAQVALASGGSPSTMTLLAMDEHAYEAEQAWEKKKVLKQAQQDQKQAVALLIHQADSALPSHKASRVKATKSRAEESQSRRIAEQAVANVLKRAKGELGRVAPVQARRVSAMSPEDTTQFNHRGTTKDSATEGASAQVANIQLVASSTSRVVITREQDAIAQMQKMLPLPSQIQGTPGAIVREQLIASEYQEVEAGVIAP